ncbi:Zeta-crystallin [Dactylellina cionopaga]|nr:Zeta-crystallin [Dactylellina cionopaga]
MRAIQISKYLERPENVEQLVPISLPDPEPKDDQYLIAIRASATNFFDILQVQGKYQHQPPLPWISGSEFAGVILKVPAKVTLAKYKVGDRVFGATQGSYATKICATEDSLYKVPDSWSFEDAAGLYVTVPTSYAALTVRANVKEGEWVLVHAGAGGVGLAAIQVAKALGARVIATAGTDKKLKICKSFGADHGIIYNDKSWTQEVMKLTGGRGVDVVYDPVGLVDLSMKCINWNGRILVIGFAGGAIEKVALNRVLLKNISLVGIHWGAYKKFEPDQIDAVWRGIFNLIEQGKFKPTVYDQKFDGLNSVGKALKALGARETWGKVVVSVPEEEERARL